MLPARLRTRFLPACLASLAILVASFYLEGALGLMPCALCFSQRVMLGGYTLVCFVAVLHGPQLAGIRRYMVAALACALTGAALAARHVWLQGVVGSACPEPLPGVFEPPWHEVAWNLLWNGSDCGSLTWSFIDLTLPEWSLMAFLLLASMPLTYLLALRLRGLATA